MAGYVVKPVLAPRAVVETEPTSILNLSSLLERMGGSRELLLQLIEVFFEDKEMTMTDLQDGLTRLDPVAVRRATHKLQGALENLGAEAASQAALRLENIARGRELGQAKEAHSALEREMEKLEPELAALAEEERQRTEASLGRAVNGGAGS